MEPLSIRDIILLLGVILPFIAATQSSRRFFTLFILWFILGSVIGYGARVDMPPMGTGSEIIASIAACFSLASWCARKIDSWLEVLRSKGV